MSGYSSRTNNSLFPHCCNASNHQTFDFSFPLDVGSLTLYNVTPAASGVYTCFEYIDKTRSNPSASISLNVQGMYDSRLSHILYCITGRCNTDVHRQRWQPTLLVCPLNPLHSSLLLAALYILEVLNPVQSFTFM